MIYLVCDYPELLVQAPVEKPAPATKKPSPKTNEKADNTKQLETIRRRLGGLKS